MVAEVSLFQVAKAPTNMYDYTLPDYARIWVSGIIIHPVYDLVLFVKLLNSDLDLVPILQSSSYASSSRHLVKNYYE